MKSSKNQSICAIGLGLIFVAAIIACFSNAMPSFSNKAPVITTQQNDISQNVSILEQELFVEDTTVSEASSTPQATYSSTSINDNNATVVETTAPSTTAQTTTVIETEQNTTDNYVLSVTYPINLNTCTFEELMSIDGIGEARASAILEYRDYIGSYSSTEQIMNIKGIGENIYNKIAPMITV